MTNYVETDRYVPSAQWMLVEKLGNGKVRDYAN